MPTTQPLRRPTAIVVPLPALLIVLLLAGCGRAVAPNPPPATTPVTITRAADPTPPPPDLRDVDPHAVFVTLTAHTQLASAAAQLAATLGIPPETVRARLQPSGCTLCDLESSQGVAGMAGLDVAAATAALAPGDGVYLFVGQFTCFYKFDGSTITPQSCQWVPL